MIGIIFRRIGIGHHLGESRYNLYFLKAVRAPEDVNGIQDSSVLRVCNSGMVLVGDRVIRREFTIQPSAQQFGNQVRNGAIFVREADP